MARCLARVFSAGALVCASGCGLFDNLIPELDLSVLEDVGLPVGAGLGEPCSDDADCLGNRVCEEELCAPSGQGAEGDRCWITADCGDLLFCDGGGQTCQPAGDAAAGAPCETTADCQHGLTCAVDGLELTCQASTGATDVARACEDSSDCLAGLTCSHNPALELTEAQLALIPTEIHVDAGSDKVCLPASTSVGVPQWPGVECEEIPEEAEKQAYFVLPEDNEGDFYRLPFPNDVRREPDGSLDLSGHLTAGDLTEVDFVQRYLDVAESDQDGFSTNPTVFFRFSHPYAPTTVHAESVLLLNLDPESPIYGLPEAREWKVSAGNVTKYLCPNWMSVRSPHGLPLLPGTPYAVVLTKGVRPTEGGTFQVSPTLDALLGEAEPSDAKLRRAHDAYAPLRDMIAAGHLDRDVILNATVFTTQTPDAWVPKLREAIRERPAPEVRDLTLCGPGVTSPCDDGTTRVCQNRPGLTEVHGRISLPIFQHGQAPYETPEDGGGFALAPDGTPTLARHEEVCFALTLPQDVETPEAGHPLVLFGHGTGGSFTAAIRNGVAAIAARSGAATLTIDLPQHGSRKHGSDKDTYELFFNLLNPRAARDNVAQGAADLMSLVHWAERFDASTSDTPAGRAIHFDPSRIVLYGHSQGSSHAALILPHEHALAAAVLSGLSGDAGLALTLKRAPLNVASTVPNMLLDPESADPGLCQFGFNCVGASHPVLSILQGVFDRVDPVNFGRGVVDPPVGGTLKHVLQPLGLHDLYSPEATQASYARAARMPISPPQRFELPGLGAAPEPVTLNVGMPAGAGDMVEEVFATQGVQQFTPVTSEDGHFVAFDEGEDEVARFLQAVLTGVAPVL